MGLFNIFKKTTKYILPESYKGILNEGDYNVVIELAAKYHNEKGIKIVSIEDGDIQTEVGSEEQHRYLDNLVRVLASNEKSLWKTLIYEHFDKLKEHKSAYNYLFSDFGYASQFLRVLIKYKEFGFNGNVDSFVHRVDFPETRTFLILEFEGQFRYILEEDARKWDKNIKELFDIAIANTPSDEILINEAVFSDKFTTYIFVSGDYAAALTLDLENRADFALGAFGSMIAIPSKGTALVHPIETDDILDLLTALTPSVETFFNDDPGSITTDFYWYYKGKIQIFPVRQDGDKYFIRLPDDLTQLFKES